MCGRSFGLVRDDGWRTALRSKECVDRFRLRRDEMASSVAEDLRLARLVHKLMICSRPVGSVAIQKIGGIISRVSEISSAIASAVESKD